LPRLSLRGFTADQADSLVNKWLNAKEDDIERFRAQLKATPGLTELMSVPLLATLIILVFRQTRRLPESKPRIYDIFIDLMCEGWNLAKGVLRPSRFGLRTKKAVLGKIAMSSHRRKSRSFADPDIQAAVGSCVAKSVCPDWREFRNELLQDCLISRTGVQYQFAHMSFQEFLAARELLGEPAHTQLNRALNDYLRGDDWWLESLRFYIGLSGTPHETSLWIVNKAVKAAGSIAGDCDLVDPEDRAEELLRSVRQIFPDAPV
jgi:predicted NACHT family NTPase